MGNIQEDFMDFDEHYLEVILEEDLGHEEGMGDNEVIRDIDEQDRDIDEGIGGSMTSIDSMEFVEDHPNILKRRHEEYDDPCDLEIKKLKLEEKNE